MYADGILDRLETQTHNQQSLPTEVMFVTNSQELKTFYQSRKDLAIGAFSYPDLSKKVIDSWLINHQEIELEANGSEGLREQLDQQTSDVLSPYWQLVDSTCQLFKVKNIKMLIKRVDDQMCPLFHVDNVKLRLIVTIQGPGTQWLRNRDVNFKNLNKGWRKPIAKENAYLQQLQTGQIAWLKGSACQNSKGLVHRSPAVDPSSGQPRLFFRVDFK